MKHEQTINQYRRGMLLTMLCLSIAILVTGTLFLMNGFAIQNATEQRTQNWLLEMFRTRSRPWWTAAFPSRWKA